MNKLYKRKLEKIFNQVDKIASKGKDNIDEYNRYIDELIDKGDYSTLQECLQIFYQIDILDMKDIQVVKKITWKEVLFQTNSTFLKKLDRLYKQRGVYQQSFNIYTYSLDYLNINLSNKLSTTYSIIGSTPSISFDIDLDVIDLNIHDDNINNVQIFRSNWVNGLPTNIEVLQSIMSTQSNYKTDIPVTHGREYLVTTQQLEPSYQVYNYQLNITNNPLLGSITEIDAFNPDSNYLIKNKQYAKLIGERVNYLEVRKIGDPQVYIVDTEEDFSISVDQNLLNRYNLALDILLS